MKVRAYALIGFVVLAILALAFIHQSERERERFGGLPLLFNPVGMINSRLSNLEGKINDSDRDRKENVGIINSTLR